MGRSSHSQQLSSHLLDPDVMQMQQGGSSRLYNCCAFVLAYVRSLSSVAAVVVRPMEIAFAMQTCDIIDS